jgi:prolipoprotein diacylglyceryl transferase
VGEWHIGPFPIRAYALCIVVGIVAAWWIGTRRYQQRGGRPDAVMDITLWAVPFGILGARIYHVITSPDAYFGTGGDPIRALYIWEGGMGIWGGIALGALGAWFGARRAGVLLPPIADALAPAILVAQGIGRLGNWFNQELFGGPTSLPWGLRVSPEVTHQAGYPDGTLFHPTFLYEALWNVAGAAFLVAVDRRWRLGHGRVFALYMVVYALGRGFIETVRIDTAHHFLGLRLNVWTSIAVGLAGAVAFAVSAVRHPGRDTDLERANRTPADAVPPKRDGSDLADEPVASDLADEPVASDREDRQTPADAVPPKRDGPDLADEPDREAPQGPSSA